LKKVYIIGPMRGYPELNFPAFDRAAKLGRSLGWDVISPAEMDRDAGIDEKEDTSSFSLDGTPHHLCRVFAKRDLDALLSLRGEDGDAVALLPGWEQSTGGKAEIAVAKWLRLNILDAQTFLPFSVWIVGQQYNEALL
jgi:hypothetical protein